MRHLHCFGCFVEGQDNHAKSSVSFSYGDKYCAILFDIYQYKNIDKYTMN